ncbi:hypothetical protein BJX68DRAFT_270187 [Aspergillus pseudodeflectus]|uniref:Uncharacterized protein n=1 Tax=Aspergillus pseudodeflectus TaxID=176178 RepID=A0ABR4JTU3_9EURO
MSAINGVNFLSLKTWWPPQLVAQKRPSAALSRKIARFIITLYLFRILNKYMSQAKQITGFEHAPGLHLRSFLLTGGSSGIGKQIMLDLARLEVKVMIIDLQEPEFPLPPNVFFYNVDITSPTAIQEAATRIRQQHGEPTVLINNAGVGYMGNITEEPESNIRRTINGHGHIVTIASMASFVGLGGMADYACSKAAALAFHESLTQEIRHSYGSKRVRTSIIHPMWVQTPLINDLLTDSAQTRNGMLSAGDISSAVVKQLVRGNGGQVVIPWWLGIGSMVRGLPMWLQEMVRDRYSRRIT